MDIDIVVVEIQEEVVYFKCHKPVPYVAKKCEDYGYGYSYYKKGMIVEDVIDGR